MNRQGNLEMKGVYVANQDRNLIDTDMDGMIGTDETLQGQAEVYAEQLATQLRKGFLAYCVLTVCSNEPKYTSDIIQKLREAEMVVVEGTIYPLLNRLKKDGLLEHEWQESEQGPPRKYYKTTEFGDNVIEKTSEKIENLNATLERL